MWRQQWLLADGVARTWHAPVGENPVFPGQRGRSLVVKPQSSKLMMRVRFSSPAQNLPLAILLVLPGQTLWQGLFRAYSIIHPRTWC